MQNRKKAIDTAFPIVAFLAALFVVAELVLKFFGTTLCATEGCALTAQAARYGESSLFLAGFVAFALVGMLAAVNRSRRSPAIDGCINFVLIVSLAGEGFFMGYLAFRLHAVCPFCIAIGCLVLLLGVIRLLAGERDLVAGFGVFAAMFAVQFFILPAGVPVHLPANERLVLFYSKDCKHCAEIIKEFDERKISVAHEPVNGFAGFLKNMGIDHVPTLLVNDPYQKVFLTGREAIMRYLASCSSPRMTGEPALNKRPEKRSVAPARSEDPVINLFNQPNFLTVPGSSPAEAGMCREEEPCK
jgi:hypothetical protein